MTLYNKILMAAVLCSVLILIESCSPSILVNVWSDSTYHEAPLKKILIISMRKNQIQRRVWEDAFLAELSKLGVKATSSYHLYPNALPDTSQILESVQSNGFDGILVIRLLQKETEAHYVEGYVSSESQLRYNPFRNTYTTDYRYIDHPGYVDSSVVDMRAIELWVVRDKERLIWGATSQTPERNSIEEVQKDIADLVIPKLKQSAIVQSGK